MGIILAILFPILAGFAQKKRLMHNIPVKGYKLVWSDEFNGRSIDQKKWKHRGLGKRDDAYITVDAIRLNGNGLLVMEVRKSNDSILAGMISTELTYRPKYGYFECRASLTKAAGVFPAFWLQSSLINDDHGTPEKNGAEIDIFEYFPNAKKDHVAHTLHWGGYGAGHQVAGPVWAPLKNTKDGFHTFSLEWTPESYTTFVDGEITYHGTSLISHVPQFLILSVLVDKQAAGPLNIQDLPDQFVVDYVRVYQKKN